MKRQYLLIGILLLISLFIYLFYRTERTVVNEIAIWLISSPTYASLKAAIVHRLPLHDIIIYSLPEGLWIFCITLTSKPYHVDLKNRRIDCTYIPLIFCCALEILQLLHVTNGRFDVMDMVVFVLFWSFARYGFTAHMEKRNILATLNAKTVVCLISYGIVYLAHVLT